MAAQIERLRPDVIWVERTELAAVVMKATKSDRWILSQHDIRSHVLRIRRQQMSVVQRWWLSVSQRAETQVLRAAPVIVTASSTDASRSVKMGAKNIRLITMAYDQIMPEPNVPAEQDVYIAHLGSLETTANRVGLEAYLQKVHPLIRSTLQKYSVPLLVIGDASRLKEPLKSMLEEADADLKGFISDLSTVLRPFNIVILPYEHDSGYRTKLPLLFNYAQVVVATRAAISGMQVEGLDQVCVIVEKLENFPAVLLRLIADPAERQRLGQAAYQFFEAHYTFDSTLEQYRAVVDLGA